MLLEIHPQNPDKRKIKQVVDTLKKGGIIIYPTDTVYGIGCDIFNKKAVERVCRLKGIKPEKSNLSFVCSNISHMTDFVLPLENQIFKLMKRTLPGAYTYILKASNTVPKLFKSRKKTVGIRIPDNEIVKLLVHELGNPILSTSLKLEDDVLEYPTDPTEMYDMYANQVDIVIDGGMGNNTASTVVDCTTGEPLVLREGAGDISHF